MSSRGSSSSKSNTKQRPSFFGVPKQCRCGASIVALTSSSDKNPYRCYLRCAYAANNTLVNDEHMFKWTDEASLQELETLTNRIARLENGLSNGMDLMVEFREEMKMEANLE